MKIFDLIGILMFQKLDISDYDHGQVWLTVNELDLVSSNNNVIKDNIILTLILLAFL